jgi:uncharacterized membrane protein
MPAREGRGKGACVPGHILSRNTHGSAAFCHHSQRTGFQMPLRTMKERMIQTLAYEGIGLVLAAPLLASAFGHGTGESAMLLALMAAVVLFWAPIHNTAFDWIDLRLSGRTACARPHRLRIVHACSYETTCIVFTLPLLIWVGGFTVAEALMADLMLTLFYVAYAYVFHLVYDRLRPVGSGAAAVAMFPAVMPAAPPSQEPAPDQHRDQQRKDRQEVEGDAAEDRQDQADPTVRRPHRRQMADKGGMGLGKAALVELAGQPGMAGHALGLGQPVGLGAQPAG